MNENDHFFHFSRNNKEYKLSIDTISCSRKYNRIVFGGSSLVINDNFNDSEFDDFLSFLQDETINDNTMKSVLSILHDWDFHPALIHRFKFLYHSRESTQMVLINDKLFPVNQSLLVMHSPVFAQFYYSFPDSVYEFSSKYDTDLVQSFLSMIHHEVITPSTKNLEKLICLAEEFQCFKMINMLLIYEKPLKLSVLINSENPEEIPSYIIEEIINNLESYITIPGFDDLPVPTLIKILENTTGKITIEEGKHLMNNVTKKYGQVLSSVISSYLEPLYIR